MKTCAAHRPRYLRLLRLPSVFVAAVVVLVAALVPIVAPPWSPAVVLVAGAGYAWIRRARLAVEIAMIRALLRSSGGCPGEIAVDGLQGQVRAEVLSTGVVRIEAGCWNDAVRALGYAMGRDRAFQMDLLRRTAQGRLAEVWGRTMLPLDQQYRRLGLSAAAVRAVADLEEPEREVLAAFADGVNAAGSRHGVPFEARFLSYRPEPWTVEDGVLIALYLFHSLSFDESAKRAEAVIRHVFPPEVADFLVPDPARAETAGGVPAGLSALRRPGAPPAGLVQAGQAVAGSNCWVRGGPAGPILACDLHLPLTMPNLLYEVDVTTPQARVRGLAVAGLPVVLTGSNAHLAWGVTNLSPDVLDLAPANGPAETTTERIRVRGRREAVEVKVSRAGGQPVSARHLLGRPVAVRWSGFDPRSCDLRFQRLARTGSVAEAVAVLDAAQGIPLNVLLADTGGRMAHLATGLLPVRGEGADTQFLAATDRPRLTDPPEQILVSANDDVLPRVRTASGRTARICFDADPGFRARRLRHLLTGATEPSLASMRALQNDTEAEVYRPYAEIAVEALRGRDDRLARLIAAWDGRATVESRAVGVLVRFRDLLAQEVLGPYLAAARDEDPGFRYSFRSFDRPLLAIIGSADPALLPVDAQAAGWPDFIAGCVRRAAGELGSAGRPPTWGRINRTGLNHPLSLLAPWSARLTGVRAVAQPGVTHTVRTCVPGFAAVGRTVQAPGSPGTAIIEIPAGQSGHPLSPHFADRHPVWARITAREVRPARNECTFTLGPPRTASMVSGTADGSAA